MIEIVGANKETDERFSHFFENPILALAMKIALEKSPTAYFIGWWNV